MSSMCSLSAAVHRLNIDKKSDPGKRSLSPLMTMTRSFLDWHALAHKPARQASASFDTLLSTRSTHLGCSSSSLTNMLLQNTVGGFTLANIFKGSPEAKKNERSVGPRPQTPESLCLAVQQHPLAAAEPSRPVLNRDFPGHPGMKA